MPHWYDIEAPSRRVGTKPIVRTLRYPPAHVIMFAKRQTS